MALDKTADAVNALHKTMVMLRQELAKKNHKINYLEARLNNDLEIIQTTTATNNETTEANESEEEESMHDNQGENGFMEGINFFRLQFRYSKKATKNRPSSTFDNTK